MADRHLFGDLALAILLALPIASVALPVPATHDASTASAAAKSKPADRIAGSGRISLLG
jgi:hypothetical protein